MRRTAVLPKFVALLIAGSMVSCSAPGRVSPESRRMVDLEIVRRSPERLVLRWTITNRRADAIWVPVKWGHWNADRDLPIPLLAPPATIVWLFGIQNAAQPMEVAERIVMEMSPTEEYRQLNPGDLITGLIDLELPYALQKDLRSVYEYPQEEYRGGILESGVQEKRSEVAVATRVYVAVQFAWAAAPTEEEVHADRPTEDSTLWNRKIARELLDGEKRPDHVFNHVLRELAVSESIAVDIPLVEGRTLYQYPPADVSQLNEEQ